MLKVTWDKILVLPIQKDYNVGGFQLETREEKAELWEVVAVWPGRMLENWSREAVDVSIWDIIYFTRYSTDEVKSDDKVYYSIKQSSVLAYKSVEK